MNIVSLKINGLFHKYSVFLDFSRKLNVLIGANGTGKSTVLKMIVALQKEDFVELARYDFDSVDVVATGTFEKSANNDDSMTQKKCDVKIHIQYEDLFPTLEYMKESYELYFRANEDYQSHPSWMREEEFVHTLLSKTFQLFENLYDNRLIYRFLICAIFDIPYSHDLTRQLEKYFEESDLPKEMLIPAIKRYTKRLIRDSRLNGRCIQGSTIQKNIANIGIPLSYDQWFVQYIDLVNRVAFSEHELPRLIWHSSFMHWLRAIEKVDGSYEDFYEELTDQNYLTSKERLLKIPYCIYKNDSNKTILSIYSDIADRINDLYPVIVKHEKDGDTHEHVDVFDYIMEKFVSLREFELDLLIGRNYYSDEFVKEINRRAVAFCKDIAEGKVSINYENQSCHVSEVCDALKNRYSINPENVDTVLDCYDLNDVLKLYFSAAWSDICDYIMPILCKDLIVSPSELSLFMSHTNIELPYEDTFDGNSHAFICFKFYEMILDELKNTDNRSIKIQRFESLVQKYIYDKKIIILPSGMKLFINTESDTQTRLSLNDLASGEKKIIVLLSLALLYKNVSFMLDEPELSLSIVWQESILTDLLEDSGVHNITIATHSPYLVSRPELQGYTIFMPEEDN